MAMSSAQSHHFAVIKLQELFPTLKLWVNHHPEHMEYRLHYVKYDTWPITRATIFVHDYIEIDPDNPDWMEGAIAKLALVS